MFFRTLWLAPISCFTFFDLDHPGAGLLVWSRSCKFPMIWNFFTFSDWFDSFGRSRLTGLRFSQQTELQVVASLAARLQHEIAFIPALAEESSLYRRNMLALTWLKKDPILTTNPIIWMDVRWFTRRSEQKRISIESPCPRPAICSLQSEQMQS